MSLHPTFQTILDGAVRANAVHEPAAELTLDTAKAYVTAYYAKAGNAETPDIIGCGLTTMDGQPCVKLNVVVEPGGELHQWDVWADDHGNGLVLYGEF